MESAVANGMSVTAHRRECTVTPSRVGFGVYASGAGFADKGYLCSLMPPPGMGHATARTVGDER